MLHCWPLLTTQTPDAEWRERVRAIQETRTAADAPASERHNGFKVLRHGPKRTKASVLPDVHTYHATEVGCLQPMC
jgi:centromere protein I